MSSSDTNEPGSVPRDDLELAHALIAHRERGEPVDAEILALLNDMERVGLTDTEAYAALDAYWPGPIETAPERDEVPAGPQP
jgi:hypothetical protein